VWLPARQLVEHAIRHRFEVDQSGEIIVLSQFCPWKEHVAQLEKELKCETAIKYVLFPDNDQWYSQSISILRCRVSLIFCQLLFGTYVFSHISPICLLDFAWCGLSGKFNVFRSVLRPLRLAYHSPNLGEANGSSN